MRSANKQDRCLDSKRSTGGVNDGKVGGMIEIITYSYKSTEHCGGVTTDQILEQREVPGLETT